MPKPEWALTEAEVEALPLDQKPAACPLCGSKSDEGHKLCFHCAECSYMQCCDTDGTYAAVRERLEREQS